MTIHSISQTEIFYIHIYHNKQASKTMDDGCADRGHRETLVQTSQNNGGQEVEHSTNQMHENPQLAAQYDHGHRWQGSKTGKTKVIDDTDLYDTRTH